jgi:uncharacterized membrane protein YeaQ/YmgE (transglycosylase-associated protein family)
MGDLTRGMPREEDEMHVLIWIAVGAIAGLLTQVMLTDNWRIGLNSSLVLGAVGAVAVSSALRLFGIGTLETSVLSLAIAFVGAALLLWARRFFVASRPLG